MKFANKVINLIILVFLVCITVFFLVQKNPKKFDGSRVKIVDNVDKNYFIRGSNPFVEKFGEKIFSYNYLKKIISQTIKDENKNIINDFYLVDINLLNLDSYFQILDEELFFKKNPQLGEFENFSEISPRLLLMGYSSNQIIFNITKKYHRDLDKIIDKIHFHLHQKLDKPIVIYVHCNAGRDRTGLISAGYRMKYHDLNLKSAIKQNIADVQRSSESFLSDAIRGYCYYIQANFNKPQNFCDL